MTGLSLLAVLLTMCLTVPSFAVHITVFAVKTGGWIGMEGVAGYLVMVGKICGSG